MWCKVIAILASKALPTVHFLKGFFIFRVEHNCMKFVSFESDTFSIFIYQLNLSTTHPFFELLRRDSFNCQILFVSYKCFPSHFSFSFNFPRGANSTDLIKLTFYLLRVWSIAIVKVFLFKNEREGSNRAKDQSSERKKKEKTKNFDITNHSIFVRQDQFNWSNQTWITLDSPFKLSFCPQPRKSLIWKTNLRYTYLTSIAYLQVFQYPSSPYYSHHSR